jgi:catechol 2,3-dioxygenase-like lactoylglutathione lyase family enzyme
MAIKVLEIHHTGFRVDAESRSMNALQDFYTGVLGLARDESRPTIPGIPGMWINVGEVGQIHLFGGEQPSPVAKGPGQDPTLPHVALAVADIAETRAELDRMGVRYWVIEGLTSPDSLQVFLNDPCGNMVELHQVDKCRCRAANRVAA